MRLLPPPLQGGWWRLFEILFQELNPPATSFVMQKLSAHEVRALATSWTSFKGVSIQEVVQAATWKSQSVFSDFYFRDCNSFADGMHSVVPIVAASHIF